MRVVCISDIHGQLPQIGACDLLLIAGDITPVTDHTTSFQAAWLQNTFRVWLDDLPAWHICGVAGNHDFVFEKEPDLVPKNLRWNYLQDSSVTIEGLKIYGTPWQPWFCDWAFNSPKKNAEEFLASKFAKIPGDTDILLAHGAPRGYGDFAPAQGPNGGEHVGSTALRDRLLEIAPPLTVFGHLHSGYGVYKIPSGNRTATLANASLLDDNYHIANPPLVFDVQKMGGAVTVSRVG
jgi:Icc-related predicted phosphoesterase